MAFTENLDVFFSTSEFAVTATVKTTALPALFDDGYSEVSSTEGSNPTLVAQTADLPTGLVQGDTVSVASKVYQVVGIKPDGTGVTVLDLEYVSG
jgi:hypothetical protein